MNIFDNIDVKISNNIIDNIDIYLNIYKYVHCSDCSDFNTNHNIYIKKLNNINYINYNQTFEDIFTNKLSDFKQEIEKYLKYFLTEKKIMYELNTTPTSSTPSPTLTPSPSPTPSPTPSPSPTADDYKKEFENLLKKLEFYFYIKFENAFRLYYDKEYKQFNFTIQILLNDNIGSIKSKIFDRAVNYDNIKYMYDNIQKIYKLSVKNNEQKDFKFLNLNPKESTINIMSKTLKTVLLIIFAGFIFFFDHLNTFTTNKYYFLYSIIITCLIIIFIFLIIVFIMTPKINLFIDKMKDIIKTPNFKRKILILFLFIYMFIIFLEISGFNEYLEAFNNDDVKQNLSVLESSHILTINKLKYYKAHDPVFRSVFYLLLSLIVLLIAYNLGKIFKYGSMCPISNNYSSIKLKITLLCSNIFLFLIFLSLFSLRFKGSIIINLFLSIFISFIIIIFIFGLIKSDFLFDLDKNFNFNYKKIFELSKNYEPFNEDIKISVYSSVDINILSEDITLAIDYINTYQNNIGIIIEPMIKHNKIDLLTKIINKIEQHKTIYKILLYLLNKSNEEGNTIYNKILQKIDFYKIIDCAKNYDDLKYINNSLLIKLLNNHKPILDQLI